MTTTKETDYAADAATDAHDMSENFMDEMIQMWADDRAISTDLNNDYSGGDSYHHSTHTDRSYSLTEAAAVLDQLSDHEETDSGLWEGLAPREAISAQAAYTYAAAVYANWRTIVEDLQSELEDLAEAVAGEEADADDLDIAGPAGARYIRLYFQIHDMADSDFGGLVAGVREHAGRGEFTPALMLADAVQERGERYDESKAQRIRDAAK